MRIGGRDEKTAKSLGYQYSRMYGAWSCSPGMPHLCARHGNFVQ